MKGRNSFWALSLSLPAALFCLTSSVANAAPEAKVATTEIVSTDANSNLNLDEGSADEWWGGWGWGGYGLGYGLGWGGWGYGGWGGWGGWYY